MGLSKNTAQALNEVKNLHSKLVELRSKYALTEVHSADLDFETKVVDHLYDAEKSCMVLLGKLIEKAQLN